ncbi:MAG: FmdB family zinc ribbon protein [Armatimonadaceae bacterium]
MPIYEFKCKSCRNQFETMRPFSRKDDPEPCPACGSQETARQLSMFAATGFADPSCSTSQASGTPCCRTIAPGGG